jgi:integrase/recombinase XerD
MQPLLEAEAQKVQAEPRKNTGPAATEYAHSSELKDLKDRYLAWMIATRYASDTIKGANSDLAWFFRYLAQRGIGRIADATAEIVEEYALWLKERKNYRHAEKPLSIYHIAHRIIGVKQFCKWLTRQMVILYDPSENLEVPRIHRGLPQTILTQEEVQRLLDAPNLKSPVGYRDKVLLELVYATGIRSGELFRVKVSEVDLKARTLFVKQGKGGKDRLIPLPVLTVGYLREYIEKLRPRFVRFSKTGDDGTLFLSYLGGKLDRSRMAEMFKRYVKAARIEKHVTAMALRHSIASHLLENGMSMRYIQEFLGHEDMRTTQIYAKATLSGLRKHYNKHHPKEKRARLSGAHEQKITQDTTSKLTAQNG